MLGIALLLCVTDILILMLRRWGDLIRPRKECVRTIAQNVVCWKHLFYWQGAEPSYASWHCCHCPIYTPVWVFTILIFHCVHLVVSWVFIVFRVIVMPGHCDLRWVLLLLTLSLSFVLTFSWQPLS